MAKENYSFLTDSVSYHTVETKSGKTHYVSGYISTSELDLYNDIVTPAAMKSMLEQTQTKNITLDYDHEVFREDITRLPVGKIVESKLDDRGLWVKCQLNSHSPKFKALWGSIKDGFINAFSIAFKPVKTVMKTMGDTQVRLIEALDLQNVALTGVPVNQGAVMTEHGMKSVMLKAIEDFKTTEEIKMPEEQTIDVKDEAQPEVPKEEVVETPKEEVKEEAPEVKEEAKPEQKSDRISELIQEMKSMAAELKSTKEELKTIKDQPIFKSKAPEVQETKQVEAKSMLQLI